MAAEASTATGQPWPPGHCALVSSGAPGQPALPPEPPPAPWAGWPLQQADALAQPQLLRDLAIGIVPCVALRDGQGRVSSQPVPAGSRPQAAWGRLAERLAEAGPATAGAPADPASDPLYETLRRSLAHNVQSQT